MRVEKKMIFLSFILFCLVIYIAVSTYGLIVDQFDDAVFIIEEGETKIIEGPIGDMVNSIKHSLLRRNVNKKKQSNVVNSTEDEVRRIIVKGRVVDKDSNPISNIMVELRSEPQYTNTDNNGNFTFENVEEGKHTITLYRDGKIIGNCEFIVSTGGTSEKINYEILPDGMFLFVMPEGEKELSFDIELGEKGNVIIKPYNAEVSKKGSSYIDRPLIVKDMSNSGEFNKGSEVDIFGEDKLIAPGFSGKYAFKIDNTENSHNIRCLVALIESQPKGADIPIKYRLQIDGRYVGGDDSFRNIERIDRTYAEVRGNSSTRYVLEWKWFDTPDDTKYAQFGGQKYTLTIRVNKI